MRGRRGKCHACGDVFTIELRVAEESPPNATLEQPAKETRNPNRSFDNLNGDLTLDVVPDGTHSSVRSSNPVKTPKPSGTVVSRVSKSDLPAIQFNCTSCRGRMEVPGEGAHQLTHCPHCKRQLTIPAESEPTPEALAANDPWANLAPLGAAPVPMQQSSPFGDTLYPPPMPMSSMSYGRSRSGTDATQFIVCGIFIAIFAFFGIAFEIFEIVINTMVIVALGDKDAVVSGLAISRTATFSVLLVVSIIQLVGGIALARRSGIGVARAGAIICCIPCVCLINFPFGIWGCVLTFGKDANRNFR